MKDKTISCDCGCGNRLWIIDMEDEQVELTTHFKKRESKTGVVIDLKKLHNLLPANGEEKI